MNDGFPQTSRLAVGRDFQVSKQILYGDDPVQVSKYLRDHHRVFNTGNDFDGATAFAAGFDIDLAGVTSARCLLWDASTP